MEKCRIDVGKLLRYMQFRRDDMMRAAENYHFDSDVKRFLREFWDQVFADLNEMMEVKA